MESNETFYVTGADLKLRARAITVQTLAMRDALPTWRRYWKMVVGVYDEGDNSAFYSLEYNLNSGHLIDNANWQRMHTKPADNTPKQTGVDAGIFGQESITDDFIYRCVQGGDSSSAIWKKIAVFRT